MKNFRNFLSVTIAAVLAELLTHKYNVVAACVSGYNCCTNYGDSELWLAIPQLGGFEVRGGGKTLVCSVHSLRFVLKGVSGEILFASSFAVTRLSKVERSWATLSQLGFMVFRKFPRIGCRPG